VQALAAFFIGIILMCLLLSTQRKIADYIQSGILILTAGPSFTAA
jgi:hypothetical protein